MAKKTIILDDYEKSGRKKMGGSFKLSGKTVKIIIAAVVLIAVAVFGIVKYINYTNSYIATVAGVKISVSDFASELSSVVSNYVNEAEDLDTEDAVAVEKFWSSTNEEGIGMRLAAKQEALKTVVERAVQLVVAEEKGIVLTQMDKSNLIREAESQAEYYANYYNSSGYNFTPESYVEQMYGVSYAEYKKLYMESYIINQLMVMMKAQMEITDDQMRAWYEKDKDAYDLYVFNSIFISYQGTDDDDETVMLEGDALKEKQDTVNEINDAIIKGEKTFAEIAEEYTESSSFEHKLQKNSEGKVSLSNSSADMEELNTWLNETGIENADVWTKIEVKGSSTGSFKDDVIGVYFVKFDSKVDFDTEDNEDAVDMKATIKEEIMDDEYNKMVEEWAKESRFEVVFNKDIYKNYTVAGYKAE